MADGKTTYTVARSDGIHPLCSCSCGNPVTVYYSVGGGTKPKATPQLAEETVDIKVSEVK